MKKILISIFVLLLAFVIMCLVVCYFTFWRYENSDYCCHSPHYSKGYDRKPYSSELTEEEHLERLTLAEKEYYNGRYYSEVYILYSFDEDPEYFLIQRYIPNSSSGELEPLNYSIGFIEDDKYYLTEIRERLYGEGYVNCCYISGENPYLEQDVLDAKKYYAEKECHGYESFFAYEKDGEIVGITDPLDQEKIEELAKNRFVAEAQTFEYLYSGKTEYFELSEWDDSLTEENIFKEAKTRLEYYFNDYNITDNQVKEVKQLKTVFSFDGKPRYCLAELDIINAYLEEYESTEYLLLLIDDGQYYIVNQRVYSLWKDKIVYYHPMGQFAWKEEGYFVGYKVNVDFIKKTYEIEYQSEDISKGQVKMYRRSNFFFKEDLTILPPKS